MNQPFIYNKPKGEIWEDWEEPRLFNMKEYFYRLHFPVSPVPDWEDGKIVRPGIDFTIGIERQLSSVHDGDWLEVEVAIPLPKEEIEYQKATAKDSEGRYINPPYLKPAEQQDIPAIPLPKEAEQKEDGQDWVRRYDELRTNRNMSDAIRQLVKEVYEFSEPVKEPEQQDIPITDAQIIQLVENLYKGIICGYYDDFGERQTEKLRANVLIEINKIRNNKEQTGKPKIL